LSIEASLPLYLERATSALLVVDLQEFIVAAPLVPHTGLEVVTRVARLADGFRAWGGLVVLIRRSGGPLGVLSLQPPADASFPKFDGGPSGEQFPPELGPRDGDVVVTKYNTGAFYGTDLNVQLGRRGIRDVVIVGIATNYGVEATARHAHERGYSVVLVSDAMSAFGAEEHDVALRLVLPRIARVRTTDDVLAALV
jgi:nicotinamidase-related amidase